MSANGIAVPVAQESSPKQVCRVCSRAINHPGICDDCNEQWVERSAPRPLERVAAARVPKFYRNFSWETWTPVKNLDDHVTSLQNWRGHPTLVLLHGPSGSGKTHAAVSVLRGCIDGGGSARFVNCREWLEEQRAEFGMPVGTARTAFNKVAAFQGLIVLDELRFRRWKDEESEFVLDVLDGLIEKRHQDCTPMIITTNHPPREIEDRLGQRVWSRLRAGMVLDWSAPDKRGRDM